LRGCFIETPSEYEIVCNGDLLSQTTENGKITDTFQAEQRRELVLIADTDYVHMERTVGDTKILGYFYPQHNGKTATQSDMENVMDAAASAMEYFNRVYMVYPFDTLIVTSAAGNMPPGGMEYSGLFTVNIGLDTEDCKYTTYHEMAHQWFYFLVGDDENSEAWLDESFAEFSALLCLEESGGKDTADVSWQSNKAAADLAGDKAVNSAYSSWFDYPQLYYGKGSVFLKELMDTIGKDKFLSILSDL